jgi:hypothetical protein
VVPVERELAQEVLVVQVAAVAVMEALLVIRAGQAH